MYRILVDNNVLYHPYMASEGYAITSGKVDLELDKTGSATISIPKVNPLYGSISKMKSMVQILDDDEELFRGRVLNDTRDFSNARKMYVEGELAFMIDNILSPYDNAICAAWAPFITWLGRAFNGTVGDFFRYYVFVYNTQVETAKQFTIGTISVSAASTAATISSNAYPTIWDELNNKLVEVYGGHVRTRLTNGVRYIDWLADYDNICGQAIEFGQNLLDINDYTSAENVITVLIPLGKDLGGSTGRVNITSVNDGHLHVSNSAAQALFGNIWEARIWDEITDPATLKALGEEYLTRVANPIKTMTIKAVDLNFAGIQTDKIRLGDKIRVISAPHGINSLYQCTKMSIDLLNPANSAYTFGDIPRTLTGSSAEMASEINKASNEAEHADSSAAAALIEAKAYADSLVLNASNAYESDRDHATDEATASSLYADLVDAVGVKVYKTTNGESRYKLGMMAQDIDAAMTALQLAEKPILTGKIVDYDELVAVLWKKVRAMQNDMANISGHSLWGVKKSYSRALASDITGGLYTGVQGACYNSSTGKMIFSLINSSGSGVLVETSLDLQTLYRVSSVMSIGHANSLAYIPSTGKILCATGSDGSYANKILEIDATSLSISGSYDTPGNVSAWEIAYDSVNDKIFYQINGSKLVICNAGMVQQSIITVDGLSSIVSSVTGQGAFAHNGVYYLLCSDQGNERTYFCCYNLSTGNIKDIYYFPTDASFEAEDGFNVGGDIYIIGGQAEVGLKRIGLAEVIRRYMNG